MGLLDRLLRRAAHAEREPAKPNDARVDAQGGDGDDASSCFVRGSERLAHGDFKGALDAYGAAIDRGFGALAHVGQARAHVGMGQTIDAADCLEVALALDPRCVDALTLLATLRLDDNQASEAAALLRNALHIAPERSTIHFSLGLALSQSGETQAAVDAYREAMRLDPADPAPHINLGLILIQQLGRPEEAETAFRHALALAPGDHAATANLGLALQDLGRHEAALELYEQGLALHRDSVELRWNRGIANLSLGRFAQGWEGYELRLRRAGARDTGPYPYPDWDGRPVTNGSLLVLAEQGLGDEIMFASCLPDLKSRTDRLVVECAPRLAPLFERSFPWACVHGIERRAALDWLGLYPDIQAKRLVGSLPALLRPAADAFARHCGYLQADGREVDAYKRRLRALGGQQWIGVSWRGGTRTTRGALRSMPIESVRALQENSAARFVCLQHDPTDAERAFARDAGIAIWDEIAADLDRSAALIRALDLVITVPNTNAHLAGALGTPVWIMLNSAPEWRWQASGSSSLWYPSARLLRAERPNDWKDVLAEARSSLAGFDRVTLPTSGAASS